METNHFRLSATRATPKKSCPEFLQRSCHRHAKRLGANPKPAAGLHQASYEWLQSWRVQQRFCAANYLPVSYQRLGRATIWLLHQGQFSTKEQVLSRRHCCLSRTTCNKLQRTSLYRALSAEANQPQVWASSSSTPPCTSQSGGVLLECTEYHAEPRTN